MSIGNATQAVDFDRDDLTLVLGENLDQGGDGARNGTGKTTLINALSYGLYGSALSEIKVNNLINKTNKKNMLVSVEFAIENIEYRIERGRSPTLLRFFKNNIEQKDDDDGAQGENRETQKEIIDLLGLSHAMFKHAVALNTYTLPFLSMKAADQKNVIEELLGITVLTEKAESLKAVNKITKDRIKEEEFNLNAVIKSNLHIEEQIDGLLRRQRLWQKNRDSTVDGFARKIEKLMELDIEKEIQSHKTNAENIINVDKENAIEKASVDKFNAEIKMQADKDKAIAMQYNTAVAECNRWIKSIERDNTAQERRSQALQKDIDLLADHKCHACGQELHDEKQEENIATKQKELSDCAMQLLTNQTQEDEHKLKLAELGTAPEVAKTHEPKVAVVQRVTGHATFYKTIDEAHGHKSSLETLSTQLETSMATEDPYTDQIADMQTNAIVEVSYDEMNRLSELQDHQAFLLKLLTSKDSFIRKKIIEQNLAYLNSRLTHYLREIGLPHRVRFMSDLSVEITDMGRDLDFDNLSRGERTRLILSLSWAFRDVWESLYNHINLLFVDELVDNGLDANGVEAAIKIMKGMSRERGKSVWLVSHRDELISRVHNTMKVVKENGYTIYESSVD